MTETDDRDPNDAKAKALDAISVAPPEPSAGTRDAGANPVPEVRDAIDAEDDDALKRDPTDPDAKLDVALDESFPTSDAPANTRPGQSSEPAPSSGFDEEAEAQRSDR